MDLISRNEINELLEKRKGICVSLFFPLEREPDKFEMNRIRLKNGIKRAKEMLADEDFLPIGITKPDLEALLEPAQKQLEQFRDLRMDMGSEVGMAVFLGEDFSRIYHLPMAFEEEVMIGPDFHIKPLLPSLNSGGRFYLLTLSQQAVQLWQGDEFTLDPIEVTGLPAGMDEALALEDPERSLQFHTSTGNTGDRAAMHFGHEDNEEKKGAILRYFREVNGAILQGLSDEKAPLLIASVDYLRPIYQEANSYPHLLAEGVSGNPEHLNTKELHQRAWETIQPHFEEEKKAVINRYQEMVSTKRTSESLDEIVPAAAYGRVETLFLLKENGRKEWGQFNQSSGEVKNCHEGGFNCIDLLNLASAHTLQNGGAVYVVDLEDMPADGAVAAIFRYAI